MNVAFIRQWAAAARSGKYRQCKFDFVRPNGQMCILGLGYHLLGKGERDHWNDRTMRIYRELEEASGLDDEALGRLADSNNMGRSFPELADRLEALIPDAIPESVRAIFEERQHEPA